jgi:hypothetical protein
MAFSDMTPQVVTVAYNPDTAPLDVSDFNILIKSAVNTTESNAPSFKQNRQSISPVNVKLIPSKESLQAKSITVVEPNGKTIVAKGEAGFSTDYDIYLRPCTAAMRSDTVLKIIPSVPDQVELSTDFIAGNGWLGANEDCKLTILVTPVDDEKQGGDHFVTLNHVATNEQGEDILLSDQSVLYASNVLVQIYNDDIGGVIVDESLGYTATAEIDTGLAGAAALAAQQTLFEDSYQVCLTKKPTEDVTITVNSVANATDCETPSSQHLNRDYSERVQVELRTGASVEGATTISLVFTSETWDEWQTVNVGAIDDTQEEGTDLLYFPSQPSFLAFIQGPLKIVGGGVGKIPLISAPLVLLCEVDDPTFDPDFPLPSNGSLYAIKANQVDYLIIHNTNVCGNEPSAGTLSDTQIVGTSCHLQCCVILPFAPL